MPKVSVIIPVYNAENFLERCLDSVLSQTLFEIEVICIDDCSSDNSFGILEEYALKDTRLKCYRNKENIGQGLIRNKGLDLSSGEYISFVDCDDWLELTMFEVLYSKSSLKKYDIIFCNFICDFLGGETIIPDLSKVNSFTVDFLMLESIASTINLYSPNAPWGKLYRKEYLVEKNIRFESERVLMYEDKFFNLSLFVTKPSIYFETEAYYHYIIRLGSTMTSYRRDFVKRYFMMDKRIKTLFYENNIFSEEIEQRFKSSLFEISFSFCLNALVYNPSFKGKFYEFRSIINDKRISSNTKFFSLKNVPVSSSKTNGLVKSICFLILKYLR